MFFLVALVRRARVHSRDENRPRETKTRGLLNLDLRIVLKASFNLFAARVGMNCMLGIN